MKTTKYIIKHHSEETACDWCGEPLYTGDTAHESKDDTIFCGKQCAKNWQRKYNADKPNIDPALLTASLS